MTPRKIENPSAGPSFGDVESFIEHRVGSNRA
jgi:hypothetical protein